MFVHTKRSWIITLPILIALILGISFPSLDAFADTTILVDNSSPAGLRQGVEVSIPLLYWSI